MYPPRCAVRGAGPARPSSQTPISPRRMLKSPSFPYCFGVLPAVLTELPQTAESRRGFFLPHRLAARPDASESLITRALTAHRMRSRPSPEHTRDAYEGPACNRKPNHDAHWGPMSKARGPPGIPRCPLYQPRAPLRERGEVLCLDRAPSGHPLHWAGCERPGGGGGPGQHREVSPVEGSRGHVGGPLGRPGFTSCFLTLGLRVGLGSKLRRKRREAEHPLQLPESVVWRGDREEPPGRPGGDTHSP